MKTETLALRKLSKRGIEIAQQIPVDIVTKISTKDRWYYVIPVSYDKEMFSHPLKNWVIEVSKNRDTGVNRLTAHTSISFLNGEVFRGSRTEEFFEMLLSEGKVSEKYACKYVSEVLSNEPLSRRMVAMRLLYNAGVIIE